MRKTYSLLLLAIIGQAGIITLLLSSQLLAAGEEKKGGSGGEGPKPFSVFPKLPGVVVVYQPVAWESVVKRGTTVAKVNLKLTEESFVYITADTRLLMKDGGVPVTVWNGFYDQEEPKHLIYEGSLRVNKFKEVGDIQSVSSTYAMRLKAGEHTIVWNIDVLGRGEFQTQSGSLTVAAIPGELRGGEGPHPMVKEPPKKDE